MDHGSRKFQEVKNVILSLNRENYNGSILQLHNLLARPLFPACITFILDNVSFENRSEKDQCMIELLKVIYESAKAHPNFPSLIIGLFENVLRRKQRLLDFIINELRLVIEDQLQVAIILTTNENLRNYGIRLLKSRLNEFIKLYHAINPTLQQQFNYIVKEIQGQKDESLNEEYHVSPMFDRFDGRNRPVATDPQSEVVSPIVTIIREIGFVATFNRKILRIIIKESQVILNEKVVGDLIMMMVATAGNQELSNVEKFKSFLRQKNREKLIKEVKNLQSCWNMGVFVDTVNEMYPNLDFPAICECFDNGYFQVRSPPSFNLVVDFFRRNRQPLGKFILRRHWKSGITQATFIYFSLMCRLPDFQSLEFSQVDLGELRSMQGMNVRTPWMNLELISCLLRLTETDSEDNFARNMFEYPMLHNKIQLLCGVAQSGVENGVSFDIMSELLGPFIEVNGQFNVVSHVSRLNSRMVTKALFVMYSKDTRLCSRIVDVLQENRDMVGLLSYQPYHLSLTLTMVSARRSIINAREIILGVMERGMRFVHDALVYLRSMVQNPNNFGIPEPLTKEEYNLIFNALSNCGNMSVVKVIQEFSAYVNHMGDERYKNIRLPQSVLSLHPPQQAPQHHSPPPPSTGPGGPGDFQINEQVEKWSTKFFETMFAGGRSVGESLQKLREFKEDGSPESQQKYATLIHNMFDEFRFFDQYPATQLKIMAEFFGRAICEELLHGKTLKYALVYVMKSLIDHNNPNYYTFGKTSLGEFKHRLFEWKDFIFQMGVDNLLQQAPDFEKYLKGPMKESSELEKGEQPEYHSSDSDTGEGENELEEEGDEEEGEEEEEEEDVTLPRSPTSNIPTKSGFLNIKILNLFQRNYAGKKPEQADETQFRFLMNNLTEGNAIQKAEEFLTIPNVEEHFDFYAMLLVANRVCLEVNNADMYAKFVDFGGKLSSKFLKSVMKMTFAMIKYIYKSEKISRSMSERQLFKTIGNWLGMITVARNRPIFKRELDVKELIIQSYNTGKLTATIPFVCRWLNCCQFSAVLRPPNPWIMCIVRLLGEVHAVEELKLNIKFDIEMMCKTLNIRLSELDRDGILDTSVPFVRSKANPDRREIHSNKSFQMEFDIKKLQLPEVSLQEIDTRVVMSEGLEIFSECPHLRPVIVVALDQAIKEIITPVVKRSVMIATRSTLDLVTKDFCPERDIQKLTQGAHNMVQNLASSLSMVTCKHPLRVAMENHLNRYLNGMLTVKPDLEMKRKISDTAKRVTEENIHVGCYYVERIAIERAKHDVNRALENEVQQRRKHHESGNRLPWTMYHRIFQEALIHAPKLPEILLPTVKMGPLQANVYAGFPKLTEICKELNQNLSPYSEKFAIAERLIKEVMEVVKRLIPSAPGSVEPNQQTLILADRNYQEITKKLIQLIQTAPNVFEFSVEVQRSIISRFYTCKNRFVKDVFIFLIEQIQRLEGNDELGHMAFLFWSSLEEEKKFCYDTIILLLGAAFPLENFDNELSKVLKTTDNHEFLQFGLKSYEILAHPSQGSDLPKTFKILMKRREVLPQDLKARLDILAQPYYQHNERNGPRPAPRPEGGPVSVHQRVNEMMTRRQFVEASPEKRNQFVAKFVDYMDMYEVAVAQRNYPNSHKLNLFVKNEMQESNLVSSDGDFAELVSLLFNESVKFYVQNHKDSVPLSGYRYMDAFTSLIGVFLRASKFDKMVLRLEMVLNLVSERLIEVHKASVNPSTPPQSQVFFHQKPYLRFFSNMLVEMNQQEDNEQKDLIKKFSLVFYKLEPNKVPGFVFGWMDLIAHRCFLPKFLLTQNTETYDVFHELIIRLFTFIHPFLWKGQLTQAVKQIYKGILRILLVLLHDFSEFLCVYHFSLIDAIPPNCIQIRNVILSAFPRHMKLPDPFTPNLKVDLLPEINISPKILSNYKHSIDEADDLTDKINNYLQTNGRNPQVLEDIKNRFMYKRGENKETKYDVTLINAVVLYVGIQTIEQMKEKRQSVMSSTGVSMYLHLTRELDYEGRYHFFNAFMNQLRYPNSHSHFFSCVILYIYSTPQANPEPEKDPELIAEQITRVLLERLIVNRPHPWGLLITFIELVKNTTFDFWNKKFIHCAPSIERLFTNVGRSCLRNVDQQPGGLIGNQVVSGTPGQQKQQDEIQEGLKKK